MKFAPLILSVLFTILTYSTQCQSVVTAKENKPRAGVENYYVYQPAEDLSVPDSIKAVVIYLHNQDIQVQSVSVRKAGNNFTFPFIIPDSTSMLLLSISKPKDLNRFDYSVETTNIIDNNNGHGYIIPLYNKEGNRFNYEQIDKATLLYLYAPSLLKLKATPKMQLIKTYEDAYQKYPALKTTNALDYHYYLDALYKEKGTLVKPLLLEYAAQMQDSTQDENKWIWAARTYGIMGMQEEQRKVEANIVKAYPAGYKAKEKFWQQFNSSKKINASQIVTTMNGYMNQFKDTSANSKDNFYIQIISLYLNNKMWDSIPQYESLISNKIYLSNVYNNSALRLVSTQSSDSIQDLLFAKTLAAKSLNYTNYQKSNWVIDGNAPHYLQSQYNKFADTYAQILYKSGQYDSAFYYQDAIYKQGGQLSPEGTERYALYSEKVKGLVYTKHLIEEQLLNGISTSALLKQLHSIYKKVDISDAKFNALKDKSGLKVLQKISEEIKTKFGKTEATNFTLKNIPGQSVSLSSLKGKVVILDFWATWCKPCIAAFPMMQQTVNQYRNDTGVVFLFIDVLENKTEKEMQENADKLMKESNYSFNVLLDAKDELVSNYMIESIPTQFIIDAKGNMVFMGNPTDNISSLVEAAKKL